MPVTEAVEELSSKNLRWYLGIFVSFSAKWDRCLGEIDGRIFSLFK